jgi:hypothetical protein
MPRRLGIAVFAALLVLPAPALGVADFRTPNKAAYCGTGHGPGAAQLVCWTPNDGFTVSMTRRGQPKKKYVEANRGYHDYVGQVLRFGQSWRSDGFRCKSRRTGLTCRNKRDHGWWLGRFRGYRLF